MIRSPKPSLLVSGPARGGGAGCEDASKVYSASGAGAASASLGAGWPGVHPAEKYCARTEATQRREENKIPESFIVRRACGRVSALLADCTETLGYERGSGK